MTFKEKHTLDLHGLINHFNAVAQAEIGYKPPETYTVVLTDEDIVSGVTDVSSEKRAVLEWIRSYQKKRNELVRQHIAQRLREAADLVEADGFPNVYACTMPIHVEKPLKDQGSLMVSISVTFSYPWGG